MFCGSGRDHFREETGGEGFVVEGRGDLEKDR